MTIKEWMEFFEIPKGIRTLSLAAAPFLRQIDFKLVVDNKAQTLSLLVDGQVALTKTGADLEGLVNRLKANGQIVVVSGKPDPRHGSIPGQDCTTPN